MFAVCSHNRLGDSLVRQRTAHSEAAAFQVSGGLPAFFGTRDWHSSRRAQATAFTPARVTHPRLGTALGHVHLSIIKCDTFTISLYFPSSSSSTQFHYAAIILILCQVFNIAHNLVLSPPSLICSAFPLLRCLFRQRSPLPTPHFPLLLSAGGWQRP